ncbi:carboxypeptidase-like regulatory domain-containing protein [Mucilaginibacter sp.]
MLKYLLLVLLLPLTCLGQITLSGKIINSKSKSPVADVSIYVNNTTLGTKTNTEGRFSLTLNKPGQYEIIVSAIGFERYTGTFRVSQSSELAAIALQEKITELAEVTIKPNNDWERNYAIFKRDFLGYTANAAACKIINPDILGFDFDAANRTLTASSSQYLVVENQALGYRIHYQLDIYSKDMKAGITYYAGPALFEEMAGKPAQLRRWKKNRLEAYQGSGMHFLRAVLSNQPDAEGFRVMRLIRPKKDATSTLKAAQTLVSTPLTTDAYIKRTDQTGLFALTFKDCLYIVYTKKHDYNNTLKVDAQQKDANHPTNIITITADYALFDSNGIIINPDKVLYEGGWGAGGVSVLLPVNYEPVP